jgi:hypothetical protein
MAWQKNSSDLAPEGSMLRPIIACSLVLLLISTVVLAQTGPVNSDNAPAAYEDKEAYEVYSTILPTEWPVRAAKAKSLVIQTENRAYRMCLNPEGESAQAVGPAIAAYNELSKKTWLLQRSFELEIPYQLVAAVDLEAFFKSDLKRGGWPGFYQQYPDSGGYIELSAVGFNDDKTVAVLYIGHHCGMLCGGGQFHVLQKKDGKWQPLKWQGTSCSWVS